MTYPQALLAIWLFASIFLRATYEDAPVKGWHSKMTRVFNVAGVVLLTYLGGFWS